MTDSQLFLNSTGGAAWPFSVGRVICLVNFVSVCEEKREERKRREKMKENFFFAKNVSRPSNPPDELAQNVSKKKKSLSDELFLHFSSKVQNLTVFPTKSGKA